MNKYEFINHKIDCLEKEIRGLRSDLEKCVSTKTCTGKITKLEYDKEYFIVGQKGQIYLRKLTSKCEEQFIYLNDLRRLFLTESEALAQKEKDQARIKRLDEKDRLYESSSI